MKEPSLGYMPAALLVKATHACDFCEAKKRTIVQQWKLESFLILQSNNGSREPSEAGGMGK
jgi:hypothetical protein